MAEPRGTSLARSLGQQQGLVAGKGNVVLRVIREVMFSGGPWGGDLADSGARGTSEKEEGAGTEAGKDRESEGPKE